ncbi:hypothetical protein [Nostoc sp.]|uniref:hypothetical protein n=1 Tax=Nostoc sp. TaxID=1180 RepID=UPI002FF58491
MKISKISTLVVKIPGYSIESVISQLRDYLQQQVGVMIPLIVTAGICDRTDIDRMLAKDIICIDFSLVPGAKLLNELDIKLC